MHEEQISTLFSFIYFQYSNILYCIHSQRCKVSTKTHTKRKVSQSKNQTLHQSQSDPCTRGYWYIYTFFFPFNSPSLTPDVRPSQFAFEIRTRVIDYRTRSTATSTSTTLLRRVTAVIARGSAICRRTVANRRGNYVVTRRDRQPTRG